MGGRHDLTCSSMRCKFGRDALFFWQSLLKANKPLSLNLKTFVNMLMGVKCEQTSLDTVSISFS